MTDVITSSKIRENSSDSEDDGQVCDIMDNPSQYLTNKELMYYKMIDKFFVKCDKEHIYKMVDIVEGSSHISLRILDCFVTRYSKKNIDFDTSNTRDIFDVRISYKAQLKSYKKRYFDPFRRRNKILFNYDKDDKTKKLCTTIGQLNFFKWAISNNIITYVEKNFESILEEMNRLNKDDKKKKDTKKKIKKQNADKTIKKSNKEKDVNVRTTQFIDDDEIQFVVHFD